MDTLENDIVELRNAIERLDKRVRTRTLRTHYWRHNDAISPNVPEGFDTVLGHLARHHPDVLDMLNYSDPAVTVRDGFKLMHLVRRADAPVIWVAAPECLRAKGINTVRAYPVEILERRWA